MNKTTTLHVHHAYKLLDFNKSQDQLQVDFFANLWFEVNYEFTNESFASSLG